MGFMHVCPHFLHLGVTVDSDTLFYVHLLPVSLKRYSLDGQGELSPRPQRTMEEQGVRREGRVHPHIQDPQHADRLPASRGGDVQWLQVEDVVVHSR